MNATAALTAVHSTETFDLPVEATHLIAKLRAMTPELRNLILTPKDK